MFVTASDVQQHFRLEASVLLGMRAVFKTCAAVCLIGAQVLLAAGPQGVSIGDIIQRANDMGLTETQWDATSSRRSSISSVRSPLLAPVCSAQCTEDPRLSSTILRCSQRRIWNAGLKLLWLLMSCAHHTLQVLNADPYFAHVGKSHYAHVGHKGVVHQPHKRTSSKQAKEHAQPPAPTPPAQPAGVSQQQQQQQPLAVLASLQAAAALPAVSSTMAPAPGQLPGIGQPGQTAATAQAIGSMLASMQAGGSLPGDSLQRLLPSLAQSMGPAAAAAALSQAQHLPTGSASTQAAAGQGAPASRTVPVAASAPGLAAEQPATGPSSGLAPTMLGGPASGQLAVDPGPSGGSVPAASPVARGPVNSIEEWS